MKRASTHDEMVEIANEVWRAIDLIQSRVPSAPFAARQVLMHALLEWLDKVEAAFKDGRLTYPPATTGTGTTTDPVPPPDPGVTLPATY